MPGVYTGYNRCLLIGPFVLSVGGLRSSHWSDLATRDFHWSRYLVEFFNQFTFEFDITQRTPSNQIVFSEECIRWKNPRWNKREEDLLKKVVMRAFFAMYQDWKRRQQPTLLLEYFPRATEENPPQGALEDWVFI